MTKFIIATARSSKGESLAAFSKRTGNQWPLKITAAMNGLSPDAPLAGQPLRVARRTKVY